MSEDYHMIPIILYALHFHTYICVRFMITYYTQHDITNYTRFTRKN